MSRGVWSGWIGLQSITRARSSGRSRDWWRCAPRQLTSVRPGRRSLREAGPGRRRDAARLLKGFQPDLRAGRRPCSLKPPQPHPLIQLERLRRQRGRGQRCPRPPPDTVVPVKTILVVDDEPEIVALCSDYLRASGYAVLSARDGQDALDALRTSRPELVVLDLGLPKLDGLDVTRVIRRESAVPIVMLTARADESDTLVGLELGADDYITKPFSPKELVARVRAVLRRAEGMRSPSDVIRVGDVELDVPRMEARFAKRRIDLTKTEFQLLATMARQPGRVFTRAQLLDAVKGVAFESYERAIDAHIKNIRRKVEANPRAPRYVLTVFGVGYRFAEPPE